MRSFLTLLVGLIGLALLAAAGAAKRDEIAAELIEGTERGLTAEAVRTVDVSHDLHHLVLEGEVPSESASRAAEDTAHDVRGVRMVDNRLRVAAATPVPPSADPEPIPAAPETAVVDVAPAPAVDCQLRLDERLDGEEIFFETNDSAVHGDSYALLDDVAAILQGCSGVRLRIEGHTDSQGAEDYNLDLSQRRAESVMRYLVDQGVAADRLTARGFGERGTAGDETARLSERRVEFKVEGVR